MSPALIVALLALSFVGTHIVLASRPLRTPLVERFGPLGFSALFSAVAAVTFTLFIHTYANVRFDGVAGPDLGRFAFVRAAAIAAIAGGIVLMTASLWRFPASTLALLDPRPPVPRGVERITRHPFFVGIAIMSFAHVLLATRLVGAVAFGAFAVLAIAGAVHQDAKLRAHRGEAYADYLAHTSLVPFAAILRGRQSLAWRELPWAGLAVGAALAFALRSVHPSIFAHGGAYVIGIVLGGAALAFVQSMVHRRRQATVGDRTVPSVPR